MVVSPRNEYPAITDNESIIIYRRAKDKETVSAGELELTKEKLRAVYEGNYLKSWEQFGKRKAESFFSRNL